MTFETFCQTLSNPSPPDEADKLVRALWHDTQGNWDAAHDLAQDMDTPDGAWVHAYLHRKEGDIWNAKYWYGRAGKPFPEIPLEAEWEYMVRHFLHQ